MRRAVASSSAQAMSATSSVSTSGVLVTAMPRAFAAARSMWSKPTLKVAIAFTEAGSAPMQAASILSPAAQRMPAAPASAARRAISAASVAQGSSCGFSRAS